jgi:transketolase
MAAYSFSNIKVCGSHVGVSIGEDGASQMGLEDMAMFRSIPEAVVLYPGDAVSAAACVENAARHRGIVYLRMSRPATPVLYGPDEKFAIGGSKVLRCSAHDAVTIVAAGITLHEALKAADELKKEDVAVRVIDAYSVQPLDADAIRCAVAETKYRAVVVEDHFAGGGLGEAVASALAGCIQLKHLCIRELPRSGKPEELLDRYGISARCIVAAVKELAALPAIRF